jgi:2-methylcitrate dehydratase PrpD
VGQLDVISPVDSPAVSRAIGDFVAGTRVDTLPPAVVDRLKRSLLDVLGCGLYGSRLDGILAPLAFVRARGGRPEATVWAFGDRVPVFEAALANGTLVNASEFQEGFSRAMAQPEVGIVPGLLALAEREHRSGADFLAAAAAGYELLIRFGLSLTEPAVFYERQGLVAPAVFGPFGSAAAGARLLGWDAARVTDALGTAAVLTPTPPLAGYFQSAGIKEMYQGFGTANGVMAVELVSAGVSGLHDWVLPWYQAAVQSYSFEPLVDRLGDYWHLSSGGLHTKSVPLIAMVQPLIGALRELLTEGPVAVDEIADIQVDSSRRVEISNIPHPATLTGARASAQFMVAAALVRQEEFLADRYLVHFLRAELLEDAAVHRLADKVRIRIDPEFDRNMDFAPTSDGDHYMKFEGRLTITLTNGRRLTAYEDVYELNGNPSRDLIERKFRGVADGILNREREQRLVDSIWRLEEVEDMADIAALMASR